MSRRSSIVSQSKQTTYHTKINEESLNLLRYRQNTCQQKRCVYVIWECWVYIRRSPNRNTMLSINFGGIRLRIAATTVMNRGQFYDNNHDRCCAKRCKTHATQIPYCSHSQSSTISKHIGCHTYLRNISPAILYLPVVFVVHFSRSYSNVTSILYGMKPCVHKIISKTQHLKR